MNKIRATLLALCTSLGLAAAPGAQAYVSVSIGINVPVYPQLVLVPGYPVYYAPGLSTNFFFYDGLYWVFVNDGWYQSSWYNGPWVLVEPEFVPVYVLRVPVRYYRQPPPYFRAWAPNGPPHWGEHWGPGWEERRRGWDHWNRAQAPRPAPLPTYQRQYSGERYPHAVQQQQELQGRHYRYQPHEAAMREQGPAPQPHAMPPPQRQQHAQPQMQQQQPQMQQPQMQRPQMQPQMQQPQMAQPHMQQPPQQESRPGRGHGEEKGGGKEKKDKREQQREQ